MSKVELKAQSFDEWMIRWRRYQTVSDWEVEKRSQSRRERNYYLAGATSFASFMYTMAPSTVNRVFGGVNFFDMGFDTHMKSTIRTTMNSQLRWTPNGYMRIFATLFPGYAVLVMMERMNENSRWGEYLKQETVFGEQARRFEQTGKIEEFFAVNIRAPLPAEERSILPSSGDECTNCSAQLA